MSQKTIPKHIGIIMDGNRRWAKKHGYPSIRGHQQGLDTLVETVEIAHQKGIKYITVYAFSTENWKRTPKELNFLMNLTLKAFEKHISRMHEQNVKFLMMGSFEGLSEKIAAGFKNAETLTKNNTGIVFSVCFNYGGQQEIVDAVKNIISDKVNNSDIDVHKINNYLYHPEVPDIDLVLRTSGEMRLSNFMLWRSAYSEFIFFDILWPDFNESYLDMAIKEYDKRQRRYGG